MVIDDYLYELQFQVEVNMDSDNPQPMDMDLGGDDAGKENGEEEGKKDSMDVEPPAEAKDKNDKDGSNGKGAAPEVSTQKRTVVRLSMPGFFSGAALPAVVTGGVIQIAEHHAVIAAQEVVQDKETSIEDMMDNGNGVHDPSELDNLHATPESLAAIPEVALGFSVTRSSKRRAASVHEESVSRAGRIKAAATWKLSSLKVQNTFNLFYIFRMRI